MRVGWPKIRKTTRKSGRHTIKLPEMKSNCWKLRVSISDSERALRVSLWHRIKISNRRATQRCNVSSFFYAKICSLLARRRSSQPVQRVYWPENVIDWLGKWRPTCVMRHARGQKLQTSVTP